ncbi:hypothetical protein MGM_03646 [Candida albicans P75063]|nr:hypothetical protein MGM_03646 [Candida albicans P75063]
MVIKTTDPDFFNELIKLPSEVLTLIIWFLPKCMLPQLLYFPPIKEIVASVILSDVNITKPIEKHMGIDGQDANYSECYCRQFEISLSNLMKGIEQCKIYPRSIYINNMKEFQNVLDDPINFLKKIPSINGKFFKIWASDSEAPLRFFINSNIKFDHLELFSFSNTLTLSHVATSIKLHDVRLNDYAIPGVKKLQLCEIPEDDRNQTYTFSSDLEDLYISTRESIQVTLPPNLRKLEIHAPQSSVDLVSEEMVNLEYLNLVLSNIRSLDEAEIIAPNLRKLILECNNFSNLNGSKQFRHLRYLELRHLRFPITLFDNGSLPELESFICWDCSIHNAGDFDKSLSMFPPNLKTLELETCKFVNADFSNWELPNTLESLYVSDSPFKDGFLGEYLKDVDVSGNELTLDSNFRIFHMVEKFILHPQYLTFESSDFMYHLPNSLIKLHLIPRKQGRLSPLIQMVKWPPSLCDITLENFNIDQSMLEFLNFKESRLEKIKIIKGDVKRFIADLFPVTVRNLSLKYMGIQQLSDSFENLENLRKLSLKGNQLRKVNPVKLPMSTLETLNLYQCNLRLISPFLVSMLEEKNKNAELKVYAWGNTNISVIDIRTALKSIKGLSLELNDFDKTLTEISKHSSRLQCKYFVYDPYSKESKSSATEEVALDYDPDDLYDGSDSSLDEEDAGGDIKRRKM